MNVIKKQAMYVRTHTHTSMVSSLNMRCKYHQHPPIIDNTYHQHCYRHHRHWWCRCCYHHQKTAGAIRFWYFAPKLHTLIWNFVYYSYGFVVFARGLYFVDWLRYFSGYIRYMLYLPLCTIDCTMLHYAHTVQF